MSTKAAASKRPAGRKLYPRPVERDPRAVEFKRFAAEFFAHPVSPTFPDTPLQKRMQAEEDTRVASLPKE
jgi:hypothetical protein